MGKETDEFLSLYRTYENLLRDHNTDYRSVEEKQTNSRMTIMRQMRNYLAHAEDPGFIAISKNCLTVLENMVKEESLKGDIVKNHLITPAKGSVKEGTLMSTVVRWMAARSMMGLQELPVYDSEAKRLKGVIMLEWAAYMLDTKGNLPISEENYGKYGYATNHHILKLTDPVPVDMDNDFYFCTKDGTLDSQYMGYIDSPQAGRKICLK